MRGLPTGRDVRAATAVAAATALAVLPAVAAAGAALPMDCGDHDPHAPIRIVGDAAFRLGPVVGVRNPGAAGTADDPYVIAGWCIAPPDPTPSAGAGLSIRDTTAHVVVRDNRVDGHQVDVPGLDRDRQPVGIRLEDADHVTVADNTITGSGFAGVEVDVSDDARIADNTISGSGFAGVDVADSHRVTVQGNRIRDNGDGIHLTGSRGATVAGNAIRGSRGEAVVLFESVGAAIRGNVLGAGGLRILGDRLAHYRHTIAASNTVNGDPVRYVRDRADVDVAAPAGQAILVNTTDARVDRVNLSGTSVGLQLAFTANTTVANVTVEADDVGVALDAVGDGGDLCDAGFGLVGSPGPTIVDSRIVRNRVGVDVEGSTGVEIHDSDLHGNAEAALLVDGDSRVDARDSWWGAASGPSGGADDACTGTVADGGGDAIDAEIGAEVRFDPWRSSPSPDAGAS